ncbi:MAG: efflux RND transporter periplasmic adaptor subunit [Firmicutes bacterium]|nr:efflux RND transporter periplasmic adaptor subunit [Bacillota bacterium]MCM1400388.1 efflux RND transporter periplasmic adaptor subunit [Bacteroides sp.]MCM1477145.1 efflux RND transporter periplasmic adaptor subunit [Bacteroides sp.]
MTTRKEMNRNVLKTASAIALGAALTITVASCGSKSEQQQQMPDPQIAVMQVTPTSAHNSTEYPALIKGKTDVEIRPQVSGFITKVHVDEGQHVKKGQVLFTIDQVQYQAAVAQAKSQVANAQAAVNSAKTRVSTAKMTADTKRDLLNKNIISQFEYQVADNDLQTARAALAQAEAALAQAQSQVTIANKNLAYTVVTAPSDGVVGSIPNREGSLASPSSMEPLTTISDNSEVYAYFSLTEKDLLDMTDGGQRPLAQAVEAMPEVTLTLANGTEYPIKGKVATVNGLIDTSTGAASVRALFNNPSGMLRSGSTGTISIPVNQAEAMVIPQKATFEVQDRRFVYLVNDSNKVVSQPITVQEISDGQNFVVLTGLKAGDRVAIEGVGSKLKDGMKITPVDAASHPQRAAAAAAGAPAAK